jgi:hemoglobin
MKASARSALVDRHMEGLRGSLPPIDQVPGGYDNIVKIANLTVDLHAENPVVRTRFTNVDLDKLKALARDFICAGTGGPGSYDGRSMLEAHRHMNVSEQEFIAVVDDILLALERNGVAQREQDEMLAIVYPMKHEIDGRCDFDG